MKKFGIVYGVLFAAWVIVLLCFTNFSVIFLYDWVGFGAGVFAFIMVGVLCYLYFLKAKSINNSEVNFQPIYFSSIYLIIAIIIDTAFFFHFFLKGHFGIIIAVNAVIFLVYLSYMLFTMSYSDRVAEGETRARYKVNNYKILTDEINSIISNCTNEDEKSALKSLLDIFANSSNVSNPKAIEYEAKFKSEIDQINVAINQSEDPRSVVERIENAKNTWLTRNSNS